MICSAQLTTKVIGWYSSSCSSLLSVIHLISKANGFYVAVRGSCGHWSPNIIKEVPQCLEIYSSIQIEKQNISHVQVSTYDKWHELRRRGLCFADSGDHDRGVPKLRWVETTDKKKTFYQIFLLKKINVHLCSVWAFSLPVQLQIRPQI